MAALFSLSDLTTPVTREEAQAAIYEVLTALGVNTAAWERGAVVRTMITSVSAMLAALSSLQSKIAASGFLDLAEDDWLTAVARYVYGVDRIEATFAAGTVTLVNAGGGIYSVAAGDLVVANPSSGKTYRNASSFTLGASATIDVAIVATEAGTASASPSLAITELVTTLLNVTVSNAAALTALDAEKDPALRLRCREKLGALSPFGPWDAYAYAARNALRSSGETAGVTRTRVLKDGYGNVTLVVANPSGTVSGTLGDTATDLGAVDEAAQVGAAPLAVTLHTQGALAVPVTVTYSLWAYNTSGYSDAQIAQLVATALQDFFAAQPIGGALLTPSANTGYLYVDALRAAISRALPEVFHVTLASPAADVALTATQVATLVHSPTANATVTQVAKPEGVL